MGPRFLVRAAGLEMHPIDQADRREYLKDSGGIGYCNITKCCTEVCPEHIKITDNAIIPLKERVADAYYDPLQWAWRKLRGGDDGCRRSRVELPVLQGTPAAADRDARMTEPMFPEPADASEEPGCRADAAAESLRGFLIRTDGAARGNPGRRRPGAALYDLRRPDARDPRAAPDASISDYLGIQTNNVAEYTGVVRALELAARARGVARSTCCSTRSSSSSSSPAAGGSRTPSSSRSGRQARQTLGGFERWTAAHVPRAQNSVADALANEAIDRAHAGGPASVVGRPLTGAG